VNEYATAEVQVPVTAPVPVFRLRPAGKAPATTEKDVVLEAATLSEYDCPTIGTPSVESVNTGAGVNTVPEKLASAVPPGPVARMVNEYEPVALTIPLNTPVLPLNCAPPHVEPATIEKDVVFEAATLSEYA
jgi:hypothetical protein